jgi:hypothetical protein
VRGRAKRGPAPRSRRPPGELRPIASEVAWLGLMAFVLGSALGTTWVAWLLRALGVAAVAWFAVMRVRYRRRRGEAVWLWDRI